MYTKVPGMRIRDIPSGQYSTKTTPNLAMKDSLPSKSPRFLRAGGVCLLFLTTSVIEIDIAVASQSSFFAFSPSARFA